MWSLDTRFKRTEIERFPVSKGRSKTEDAVHWQHLQFPVTVQEYGPVSSVDICPQSPHHVAVTGSTRVQIFNPLTNEVHKTLSKFRDSALGAKFRPDGQLIAVGGEDGTVKVFDVTSKTLLRSLRGHKNATHNATFLAETGKHLASFSDDKTIRIWDISTEEEILQFNEHTDYVRAGCVSPVTSDIVVSGCYDHSVKLWDRRQGDKSTLNLNHGCPVESVLMLPNGTLLVTAGGQQIKVWDILAGGRLLATMSPHNKTITSLGLATNNSRLVSASLDRQLKFHDISTFRAVHSISFPSPILSAAVAPDDSVICAGMSDGLVQFLHRKVPPSLAEREAERIRKKPSHKYLQFTEFTPKPGDVLVSQDKKEKESRHDFCLRKFEYSKALDHVVKPYVQQKHPEYTYSVLKELKRRNGLKTAVGGRDEKSLTLLLQYLVKYVNDPRFSLFLMEVVDVTLDLYAENLGTCPPIDKLFVQIRKRIDREARNMRTLMMLQGSIDLVLTASHSSDKPELRCEETTFRQQFGQKGLLESEANLSLNKTLLHSA